MSKRSFEVQTVKFIARCEQGDYHSPKWRDTEADAIDDALRHKQNVGMEHEVNIYRKEIGVNKIK